MFWFGKRIFFIFLLFVLEIEPTFAAKQLTFYSLPQSKATKNFNRYALNSNTFREYFLLNGTWEVKDAESGKILGNINVPSTFYHSNTLIYLKHFKLQKDSIKNYFVHFKKLIGYVQIFINKKMIYSGSRNFLPLTLALPLSVLNSLDNVLELKITPYKGQLNQYPIWTPINLPRIDNGISGSVYIESTPNVCIKRVNVTVDSSMKGLIIRGGVFIQTSAEFKGTYGVEIQIRDKGKLLAEKLLKIPSDKLNKTNNVAFEIEIKKIEPWSLNYNNLYNITASLKKDKVFVDQVSYPFSYRKFEWKNNKLFLNGQQIQLKGINYIFQDSLGTSLLDQNLILNDLLKIKEKGFNAVRIGFYPTSPLFYDITDSLGILCLQDLPFSLINPKVLRDSIEFADLTNYITHYLVTAEQHPSILGIGIGGLFKSTDLKDFNKMDSLYNLLKNGGKYNVYACSFNPLVYDNRTIDFACLEILERNEQEQFLSKIRQELPSNIPIFISGSSKAISYRVDSSVIVYDLKQITELYQRLSNNQWKELMCGEFILNYSDYYLETPSLQTGPQNDYIINKNGIYNLNRKFKKNVQAIFTPKRNPISFQQDMTSLRSFETYLYIIIGLINFLIFLLIYRSLIEFRRNIFRAIRKPHGFFMDLHERRLVTYGQSFFLMVIIAVNGAIMLGGILNFFKNNLFLDYLLSLLFNYPQIKIFMINLIWKPYFHIPIFILLIMFVFILLAIPIRLVSFFREPKIRVRQALSVSAWAGAPFLILLPFGMFFYNLLIVMNSYWILLGVLLYFHLWYFVRWMTGTRVMTALSYPRVFLYVFFILAILGGSLFYLLQKNVNVLLHLDFLLHLFYYYA